MTHTSSSNTTTVHSCVRLTKTLGKSGSNGLLHHLHHPNDGSSDPPLPCHSRPPMVPGFGKPMLMTKPSLSRVSSTASSTESVSGGREGGSGSGVRSATVSRQPSYDSNDDNSSICDNKNSFAHRQLPLQHPLQHQQQQSPQSRGSPSRQSSDAAAVGGGDDSNSSHFGSGQTPCFNSVIGSCMNSSASSSNSSSPTKNRSFLHGGGGRGRGAATRGSRGDVGEASGSSVAARSGSSIGSTATGDGGSAASVASLITSFGIYTENNSRECRVLCSLSYNFFYFFSSYIYFLVAHFTLCFLHSFSSIIHFYFIFSFFSQCCFYYSSFSSVSF